MSLREDQIDSVFELGFFILNFQVLQAFTYSARNALIH